MRQPKLIVFDFDGTLAETRLAVSSTVNHVLAARDLPRVAPEFIHRSMGLPLEKLFARMIPPTLKPFDVAPLVSAYRVAFEDVGAPLVAPREDAGPCLAALASREIPVAIATSRSGPSTRGLLTSFGWDGVFVSIASCERVDCGKPAPDLLCLAMREAGHAAADTWMVGDTIWDVQMAQSAGVWSVAVEGGSHGRASLAGASPDQLVASLEELVACLE